MMIKLTFNRKFSHIAGNELGQNTYKEQIENKYNGIDELVIQFPEYIEGVSISFVQGLIKQLVNEIGKDEVIKKVKLKSSNEFLNKRLDQNLRF